MKPSSYLKTTIIALFPALENFHSNSASSFLLFTRKGQEALNWLTPTLTSTCLICVYEGSGYDDNKLLKEISIDEGTMNARVEDDTQKA
jgi:hypothetical protein